jgi:Trypsin
VCREGTACGGTAGGLVQLGPGLRDRPAAWGLVLAAALTMAMVVVVAAPRVVGAERLAIRLAAAVKSLPRRATTVPAALLHGRFYTGTPAVGALFSLSGGHLGRHFCTASVVDSPVRDLVITAAHCVSGRRPGRVAFVPGTTAARNRTAAGPSPGFSSTPIGRHPATQITTWPSGWSASRASVRRCSR